MINKFTIRKNTIEIHSGFDEYNLPTIIHRSCIAYLNYEDAGTMGYRIWFNYHNPIHKETGFMLYCDDYLPFVAWFDDDDLASLLPYVESKSRPREPLDILVNNAIKAKALATDSPYGKWFDDEEVK